MADDQTNPFTMAGMAAMMQPNKYIDPAYKDKPLPLPGFYGTPTDAQGKPIQSFTDAQSQHDAWDAANPAQGTTLNSTPQQSSFNPAAYAAGRGLMNQAGRTYNDILSSHGGQNAADAAAYPMNQQANAWMSMAGQPSQAGAGQTAAGGSGGSARPQNPVDMRQAYLTALSNPGKVTTPGANVPQSQPLGTPSVLNAFLAAHPSGGTAAPAGGGYGNEGFFATLNKLRSA